MKKYLKKLGILLAGALCACTAAGLAACGEEETPTLQSGASTTLVTSKLPEELSPENVIYAFLQKQSELTSYKITTEGKAVADLAGYEQEIHNITYKNGEDFLNQAQSDSFLVKMKHQAFSKDGKVVYRDKFEGDVQVSTKEDYKKVYGFTADDVTLGGYIINEKTLRYATLEKTEGDTLTYYYRLAGDLSKESGSATESATTGVRLQSKAYGSLDNVPSFSDVDLRLTIKKDWTPVSYSSECSYACKKVFSMNIVQTLNCTYSEVNKEVAIPSVGEFNEKLGTTPSEVKPIQGETSPTMQLTSALGAAMDEKGTLTLPVSLDINVFGASLPLAGDLTLKVKRDALNSGDILNAFALQCGVDLTSVPLLSQVAKTLSLRYTGEGMLLLSLNGAEGNALYTSAVDLGALLPDLGKLEFTADSLQALAGEMFELTQTETGYLVTLKPLFLQQLNESYQSLLTKVEQRLGNTHGYIRSFLGTEFTSLTADLAGLDKTTGLSLSLKGTPTGNVTMGEKIDLSLDIGLLNNSGLFSGAFGGELQLRLNPAAIWTGDYFAIAQGKLHLDITSAQPILQLLGALGGMVPGLPSWLSADLSSLDLYYEGDGMMTLALNNTAKNPVFVTSFDLKELLSAVALPDLGTGETGETGGTDETGGTGETDETQGMQGLNLPPLVIEFKENGISLSLGETLVQALDAAYQALVQTAVDYVTEAAGSMGEFAGAMIKGWIDAKITGAGIFVGITEEGKLVFNLNVDGILGSSSSSEAEAISLLSLTLTHQGELESAEKETLLALGDTVKKLNEMNDKAAEYDAQVQKFIDEMDVSEAGYDKYVSAVTALQEKIASEEAGVRSLMATKSYLAVINIDGQDYTLLLLTAKLYHDRAGQFKEKVGTIEAASPETVWDELNAIYEKSATVSGVTVPAIKGNEVLESAVGEEMISSYLAKRNAHEEAMANALKANIEAADKEFDGAKDRDDWTAALTEIVTDFKPAYDKLPEDLQKTTGYQAFVKEVYTKNIEEVTKAYNEVKADLEALAEQGDSASIDDLLKTMKKLSEAYAWGYGYDYWETNTIEKVQPWGTTWITSLKPSDLSEEEQKKVSDLNTLNRSFMKGTIATEIGSKYTDLIVKAVSDLYNKIKDCRTVGDDGKETWNFGALGEAANEQLLEEVHGIRFLICKVLPASINDEIGKDDPALSQFARIDLTKYEKALGEYLKAASND